MILRPNSILFVKIETLKNASTQEKLKRIFYKNEHYALFPLKFGRKKKKKLSRLSTLQNE